VTALRETGSVAAACRLAGVSRTFVYRERALLPAFAEAWQTAARVAEDRVQYSLFQLGVVGVPVVKTRTKRTPRGVEVVRTEYRRYSDRVLIELLCRRDPAWRDAR
jgi:hypothetical protein